MARNFEYTPGLGQSLTALHFPPREKRVHYEHIFHKNSFLLQESKIFRLIFQILELLVRTNFGSNERHSMQINAVIITYHQDNTYSTETITTNAPLYLWAPK
jgi:hypothetical protein